MPTHADIRTRGKVVDVPVGRRNDAERRLYYRGKIGRDGSWTALDHRIAA